LEVTEINPSSFRDISGFVFSRNGQVYRQVNKTYQAQYDHLMKSGLYDALVKNQLLVIHEELEIEDAAGDNAYRVIRPQQIPYVSYAYEWSFSQLKDAALCTLDIQRQALKFGMVLKDSSAYNIQFLEGRPIFIDTLSFDFYEEGKPWVAYKQFCQHFIAPLALMSKCDFRLSQLLRVHIDGIPIDLASELLPWTTRFSYSLLTHIHLHASSQKRYANLWGEAKKVQARHISKLGFEALMDSISSCVRSLEWNLTETEWGDYYTGTNYQDQAMAHKEALVAEYLEGLNEKTSVLHDLGANNGHFSRIAEKQGYTVIAHDIDPVAVEKNYLATKQDAVSAILPLLQDLTNPSGWIGWATEERESFMARCQNQTIMALALVHHLAISNNVPLEKLSNFFAALARYLIVEFIPKEDSQVQRLLATRSDIFPDYHMKGFEKAFAGQFRILRKETIIDSSRVLYLLEKSE
jgi:hypothetical protein